MPVTKNDRAVGVLHRTRFLEYNILGKYGFGMQLNSKRLVADIMEQPSIIVESNATLEDVAKRVYLRSDEFLYDDICVTKNGNYYGTVAVSTLLNAITKRSLILAKHANPLTGLPGNNSIQMEVEKGLSQNKHFDVCYIDIDNFKPYNDHYGFEKGDVVLKSLAHTIEEALGLIENHNAAANKVNFAGHIGGDDFIIITSSQNSIPLSEKIISNFEGQLLQFQMSRQFRNVLFLPI